MCGYPLLDSIRQTSMMLLLSVIVLQILFHSGQGLVRCNETVTKFQICSLAENYEQGWPIFKHGRPMMIANSIHESHGT